VIYNTEQSSLRFHQAGKNVVQGNILSNKEGVPMFRYNSTPEESIGKIDNRNLKPDSPEFIEAVKRIEAIRAGVPVQ
jgi:flagella basal body P-ring formation protein FlgA